MIRNAFNNHIDTIYSGAKTPTKCDIEITIGTDVHNLTIYPNPLGEFYFNWKAIMSKLVNLSNFKDDHGYTPIDGLSLDPNAFIDVAVKKVITFDDNSTETVNETNVYLKGVHNIDEKYSYLDYYPASRGNAFFLHRSNANKECFLRYWLGMPFDFALYGSDITLSIWKIITSGEFLAAWLATPRFDEDQEITEAKTAGVYRFTLSNGIVTTQIFEAIEQYSVITFNNSNVLKLQVLEAICGGVYLKWHNQFGGWDYWMFERSTVKTNDGSPIGMIENDFENIEDTESPVMSSGRNAKRVIQLFANGVYDYEVERLAFLASSPKVLMYLEGRGEASLPEWLEVSVTSKTPTYKTNQRRLTMSFEIELPTYNLTL